jgi:hypothetical protein
MTRGSYQHADIKAAIPGTSNVMPTRLLGDGLMRHVLSHAAGFMLVPVLPTGLRNSMGAWK